MRIAGDHQAILSIYRKRWYDDNGVLNIGIIDFLLDETII